MKLSDLIRLRIKHYLTINNMNVWTLCKYSGVPCHICNGFNITLKEFFSDPAFDTAEQD